MAGDRVEAQAPTAPSHRCCRLSLCFAPARLKRDLENAVTAQWTPHFVERNYEGDWSAIALRSIDGAMGHARSEPSVAAAAYRDTNVLLACGYFREVLAQFQCAIGSARLLRLAAGSVVREHTDDDLGYEGGTLRLHVPIRTQPAVEFYVEGERVFMREGECWYVDTSLPHRVHNRSRESRVHLVFDCELNDWLRAELLRSGFRPREKTALERRGVRGSEARRVAAELRALGTAVGARLANELEDELGNE
jgi:hypothetical protein